jgi:hypothetical protein
VTSLGDFGALQLRELVDARSERVARRLVICSLPRKPVTLLVDLGKGSDLVATQLADALLDPLRDPPTARKVLEPVGDRTPLRRSAAREGCLLARPARNGRQRERGVKEIRFAHERRLRRMWDGARLLTAGEQCTSDDNSQDDGCACGDKSHGHDGQCLSERVSFELTVVEGTAT